MKETCVGQWRPETRLLVSVCVDNVMEERQYRKNKIEVKVCGRYHLVGAHI